MKPYRKNATLAGILFLIGFAGVPAALLTKPLLGAADFLMSIPGNESRILWGAFLQFLMASACAGIGPGGLVKVVDFGIARRTLPAGEGGPRDPTLRVAPHRTEAGALIGTAGYMSPEQVRGLAVTPQADIFSFGAVLYEMLAGRRAFQGESAVETMTAVLREDPPDLLIIDPRIPPPVAALVRHCLEKQVDERFQSARDVAFHLASLAGTPTPTPAMMPVASGLARAASDDASLRRNADPFRRNPGFAEPPPG